MKKLRLLATFLLFIAGFELFNKGMWLMSMDNDLDLYLGMAICGLTLLFGVEALEFILNGRKKKENEKVKATEVSTGVHACTGALDPNSPVGMCDENRTGIRGDRGESGGVTAGGTGLHT